METEAKGLPDTTGVAASELSEQDRLALIMRLMWDSTFHNPLPNKDFTDALIDLIADRVSEYVTNGDNRFAGFPADAETIVQKVRMRKSLEDIDRDNLLRALITKASQDVYLDHDGVSEILDIYFPKFPKQAQS